MLRSTCLARALVGLLLIVLVTLPAWPQSSTATVTGTVRDQTSAVIPGAVVTLISKDTNHSSKAPTNSVGFYEFPGLVPGPYLLLVEATGMQKFEGSLTVLVQQSAVVDVNMKLGQTASAVSVQDVTPILQVDNPTLGDTLERSRIEQLPINGRNLTTLLQVVPGQEGTRSFGLRDYSFEMVLDGSALADRYAWNTITARQPGLDSIQEFKVENNGSSAKFSRPTSIVLTTKGGTNELHGTAFETNRNNAVGLARSRTDYYSKPPFLNRNEFGVSGGGPVYLPKVYNGKNKTFWFFSYEALRNINASTLGFSVPTPAQRNGDLSGLVDANGNSYTIYDPASTNADWGRTPFPNNQLPQNRESPLAKYLLNVTQLPTLPNVNPNIAYNWFGGVSGWQRNWTTSTRIDHRFSDKDVFYGRYSQGGYKTQSQFYSLPTTNWTLVPSGTQGTISPNKSFALSYVHTFSPSFFNELLVTGTRQPMFVGTGDPSVNYDSQLGLPNPFGATGWPGIYSAGFSCCGSGLEWETQNSNGFAAFYGILDDNVTKIKGRHQLQFGFHFRYDQMNNLAQQQQVAGNDNFATGATSLYDPTTSRTNPQAIPYTGDNLANFYLGMANYSNQLARGMYYARSKEYAGYFQDNWRVSSRLTLNLGLRYDFFPPYTEKNNMQVGFDPKTDAVVLGTTVSAMETLGYTVPSVVDRFEALGGKFETYQQAGLPRAMTTGSNTDFGPRIGFAYKAGDGAKSFVVRGGYRISYFHIPLGAWSARMRSNVPMTARFYNSLTQAAYTPDGIANYGLRTSPTVIAGMNSTTAVTLANAGSLAPGAFSVSYLAPSMPDPRVQDWNFTLEKEVMSNTVVRVSYFGNHTDHLEQINQFNTSTPAYLWYTTTGQALPTGPLANVGTNFFDRTVYGQLEEWQNIGWGNSNGLTLGIERRFSKGVAYQVFYTLDNNFAAGGQGYQGTSVIPPVNQFLPGAVPTDLNQRDAFLNYQRDTSVPKHRVRWNWLMDLPVGRGKRLLGNANRVVDRFIGGWQVAGLGSLASNYFTLPTGDFPTGVPLQIYGYKYPIQNCTSGTCYPGYLWYNGYIPANRINSVDPNTGKPNGYEGIPANYKPAVSPLIPYGDTTLPPNAPAGTNVASFYNTNTVWVPLKDGTVQRTTWAGLAPLQHQYQPSIIQWSLDASLFKTVPVTERIRLRINADFFNVLNHPGNPNSIAAESGILNTQSSGQSPRTLQLTLRLSW